MAARGLPPFLGAVFALTAASALLAGACTHDYGAFTIEGSAAANGEAGAVNGGGSPGSGGTSGTAGGSTGGSGGVPDAGGSGAAPDAAVDGSAGGPDAAPDGSGDAPDAAPDGTGTEEDAGADGEAGCPTDTKECASVCAPLDDPETGCAAASCEPCAFDRATAVCSSGSCALGECDPGFGDCNSDPEDGCEEPIDTLTRCGGCDRACSGDGVAARICSEGVCASTCVLGRANCSQPETGDDDGCELDVTTDANNCGGCGNGCRNGLSCLSGACGCTADGQCREAGPPVNQSCDQASGLCECNATTCAPGETCRHSSCSCNGGDPCTAGQTCCQTPSGCRDLDTDPESCGACGRACAPGFLCEAGECACDGDASCDAGGGGTCTAGACICGETPCAPGQRCLPGAECG